MPLYGSFHFYTEGRHRERRRETYYIGTQRKKKIINMMAKRGLFSCRRTKKGEMEKREKTEPDRPRRFIIIILLSADAL